MVQRTFIHTPNPHPPLFLKNMKEKGSNRILYHYYITKHIIKKSRTRGYKTPVLVKGAVVTKFKFCDQGIIRFVRCGNKIYNPKFEKKSVNN